MLGCCSSEAVRHPSFNSSNLCSLCCRSKQSCHLPGSFCYGLCPEAVNHGRKKETGRWGCGQLLLGFTGPFPCLPTLPEVQRPTLNHAAPNTQGTADLCACIPLQPRSRRPHESPLSGHEVLRYVRSKSATTTGQDASRVCMTASRVTPLIHPIICGLYKHYVLSAALQVCWYTQSEQNAWP